MDRETYSEFCVPLSHSYVFGPCKGKTDVGLQSSGIVRSHGGHQDNTERGPLFLPGPILPSSVATFRTPSH